MIILKISGTFWNVWGSHGFCGLPWILRAPHLFNGKRWMVRMHFTLFRGGATNLQGHMFRMYRVWCPSSSSLPKLQPCHWSLLAVLPQCWIKLPQQSSTEKRHHVFHSHSKPCKIIQNHSSYHSKCSIVFNHIHVFPCIFTKFIQIHSPFSRKKVPLHQLHNGNDRVDRVSYVEFQWISMT